MAPNDFPHAFAQIARTAADIQDALTVGQIELPNCLKSLRNDVPGEIVFSSCLAASLVNSSPVIFTSTVRLYSDPTKKWTTKRDSSAAPATAVLTAHPPVRASGILRLKSPLPI